MKKYILLGVLALALLVIPMAVAADTKTVEVSGDAACWYTLGVDQASMTFPSFAEGEQTTAALTVSESSNCAWRIDVVASGPAPAGTNLGKMCIDDTHCLTEWFQGYLFSQSPGAGFYFLDNSKEFWNGGADPAGDFKYTNFKQVVDHNDLGGHYTTVVTFTISPG